jgi:bacterioferritin-associated ferredoxin
MIVCHCMGVSDRSVRRAIQEGASTRRDVARACRAGTGCGGCRPLLDRLLASERDRTRRSVSAAIGELSPSK